MHPGAKIIFWDWNIKQQSGYIYMAGLQGLAKALRLQSLAKASTGVVTPRKSSTVAVFKAWRRRRDSEEVEWRRGLKGMTKVSGGTSTPMKSSNVTVFKASVPRLQSWEALWPQWLTREAAPWLPCELAVHP